MVIIDRIGFRLGVIGNFIVIGMLTTQVRLEFYRNWSTGFVGIDWKVQV